MSESTATLIGVSILVFLVLLMAWAPGHIARSRGHASADAIAVCGWLSLFLWPLWLVAVIWAHTGTTAPRRTQSRPATRKGHRMTRQQWDAVDALENMH